MSQAGKQRRVGERQPGVFRPASAGLGWGLTAAFVAALGLASYGSGPQTPQTVASKDGKPEKTVAGLSTADAHALQERFTRELWPALQKDCAPCHGQQNASQFLLLKEPKAAFLKMLAEGHFDGDNHASTVHRVTTSDKAIVMPPPSMGELKREAITAFEKFAEDVTAKRLASGVKPDEIFPAHLETPFAGKKPVSGLDNTFVTFRQFRGKIKTIFGDDGQRDERNLFTDNVHLFGGADFIKRFDESGKATPTYLTAVDIVGRDIASQAYLAKTGPFAGLPETLPAATALKAPTAEYKAAINRMYTRMLFRDATPQEISRSFAFLQSIYKAEGRLKETVPQDLRFALTVSDDAGRTVTQNVALKVTADTRALTQEFVDQSKDAADATNKTATRWLYDEFTFKPGDDGQKIHLTNAGTHGNVSVVSVTLRGPLPATTEKVITVEDAGVRPEGAWRIKKDNGFLSYEDNNENKGDSHITFPVKVEKAGQYEVGVTWRRYNSGAAAKGQVGGGRKLRGAPTNGAENVLVEVVSHNRESALATPAAPPVPPKGEARFFIDQTLDTIPYADLKTAFQFGESDSIEIRNEGTRKTVVADAVRLLPPAPKAGEADTSVVLRGKDARGKAKWFPYPLLRFRPYNTVGPDLFQDTDDKGTKKEDVSLTFQPAKAKTEGYDPAKFYRVGIVYPGKVENETRVPVVVRAKASSPIVQIVAPLHAHIGAPVTLDASSTFNLQHSPLKFRWTQTGGPRVTVQDPNASRLVFTAPAMTAKQAAWEGLARALMAHPDFLFTRPRSLQEIADAKQRRRLLLVKLTQDLLARAPTSAEVAEVDRGTPIATFVDRYLKSEEFKDFYFHRTRLYLESHGTPEQDEPARLWTYIALNDRPFKEILTADYTIDADWKRAARPPYHGKTGVLTMKGFIQGKPGLPHFNYPAQVLEKFMGYVFEVPDSVLQVRDGITASATTDPNSVCYTCHKVLTPLAYQRQRWSDEGIYRLHDETNIKLDDGDQNLVSSYPYKGNGIEAFATQAQNKERFIRTILQNHFIWYFGRELRHETDERVLYRRLWDVAAKNNYAIRPLIRAIVLSPEYLNGPKAAPAKPSDDKARRLARLTRFHEKAGVSPRRADGGQKP